jgi:ABC-type cobalamin/Fe3+-siderophores transport system ATPase subunit
MTDGFDLRGVGMAYHGTRVLSEVTLSLHAPQFAAIVGPNGAGKSTLLSILAGLREGFDGECRYGGRSVTQWPRRDFARLVSAVPQSLRLDFPFRAEEVVLMGRTPHAGGWFDSAEDLRAAEDALKRTDAWAFRQRDFRTLSGGERQRVVLAAALAQQPRVLLLDEPTTFLDIEHQLAIYRLLRELSRQGLLVVAVTHDLNLAATFADRVIALRHGLVLADGPPDDALGPERLAEVFHVSAQRIPNPAGGWWITYGE